MTLFEFDDLSFAHENGPDIFSHLSLTIEAGERIALTGPNGSGKTTLLRLMNGLYFARSGSLLYRGTALTRRQFADQDFRRAFRLNVALLFQNAGTMLFHETVEADLRFSLQQRDLNPAKEDRKGKQTESARGARQVGSVRQARPVGEQRLYDLCSALHIEHLLKRPPYLLSEGEKKRVALACLLILNPTVLLLDEPFAGLDTESEEHLLRILKDFDGTLIVSTHQLALIPRIADRTIHLDPKSK